MKQSPCCSVITSVLFVLNEHCSYLAITLFQDDWSKRQGDNDKFNDEVGDSEITVKTYMKADSPNLKMSHFRVLTSIGNGRRE